VADGEAAEWGGRRVGSERERRHLSLRLAADVAWTPHMSLRQLVTDKIGQDRANDLSHIAVARQRVRGEPDIRSIVEDLRIFHEHALALGSAYAVAEGLDAVMWMRHRRYAWA
jgi:hypothetical protein